MQKFIINNGSFSAKGFSGYTAKGERIHIFERQMESIGIKKGDDLKGKLPFYVLAEPKSYGARLDDKGQPIPNADGSFGITNRLTCTAIFSSIDQLGQAFVEEKTLDARIDKMVNDAVASYKLDTAKVGELSTSAI